MAQSVTSGNFTFTETGIDGLLIVDVKSYGDERGYFVETYKAPDFAVGGITCDFVQDNQSSSGRGVLRGLHFQIQHPQAKLVRVIHGEVFDVAVDLRPGSPTYGKWAGEVLSAENHRQFFIPRGFRPGDEGGIMWNDPAIGVEWPPLNGDDTFDPDKIVLSEKDKRHPPFAG